MKLRKIPDRYPWDLPLNRGVLNAKHPLCESEQKRALSQLKCI